MGYTAKNIDTDKMLECITEMRREAERNHYKLIAIEEARFEQERKSLDVFASCFHCSNYEKDED